MSDTRGKTRAASLASAHHFPGQGTLYEVTVGRAHHDHLICEQCGRIVEFANDEIEDLQESVAKVHGFLLLTHRHELLGRCADCRRQDRGPA